MKTITISYEDAEILTQVLRDEIAALTTRIDLRFDFSNREELARCQHRAATLYHIKQKIERAG